MNLVRQTAQTNPLIAELVRETEGLPPGVANTITGGALPIAVSAPLVFSGQFYMTGSRLLVQENIADQVRMGLARLLGAVKVGPAADPESEIGPIISKHDVERIDQVVEEAIAKGARVIVRCGPITDGPVAAGTSIGPRSSRSQTTRCQSSKTRCSGRCSPCRRFEPRARRLR
jgi:acyl-CoA reductase-like NAD-dependent aldehyde dehydrogenase